MTVLLINVVKHICLIWGLILLATFECLAKTDESSKQGEAAQPQLHPLAPLSAQEIQSTSEFIRRKHPEIKSPLFVSISLLEPPKSMLVPFLEKARQLQFDEPPPASATPHKIPRKTFTILMDQASGQAYEVILKLTATPSRVEEETFKMLPPGTQPPMTLMEEKLAKEIIIADAAVAQRIRSLGVDPELVEAAVWTYHLSGNASLARERLVQVYLYYHLKDGDNEWAHPLNFLAVADLIKRKVVFVEELPVHLASPWASGSASASPETKIDLQNADFNFDPEFLNSTPPSSRTRSRGLPASVNKPVVVVSSPFGSSFLVSKDGYEIWWQKFKFRVGFNHREGLTLHDVSSHGRPILYRASIAEMFVPYGDPRPPFDSKRAFDIGEYGAGFYANSLQPGVDCLPDGYLIDAYFTTESGDPVLHPRVICIAEEDGGLLHKHTTNQGKVTIARAVVLSVHMILTVGNYDYGLYWKFGQDATISFQAKLTGIINTNLVAKGVQNVPYGTIVAPQLLAPFHQHLFSARLDISVDGEQNSISTVDVQVVSGTGEDANIQGIVLNETQLNTELEGITDTSAETDRVWKIANLNSLNDITGSPVSWVLVPANQRLLFAKPQSTTWKTAQYASHSVWVTKFREGEHFPAGNYVNQPNSVVDEGGLPLFVKNNEKIANEDIVIWHTFGTTHLTRVEDFPIMAVENVGFTLKPRNFFHTNPSLP